MKVTKAHFEELKKAIEQVLKHCPDAIEDYQNGNFHRSEKVKDLQTRFNFDLYYASGINKKCHAEGWQEYNDTHIATALNKICPKIKRNY